MLERIYSSSLQTGRCNQWTPTEREVVESWNWQLVGRVEQRKRSILLMPNGKLKKENKFFVFAFFFFSLDE